MKSERASVARLDDVLHLFGEDRRIAAVANLARADAGKGDPADIRQPARSKLLADFLGRVRRRWHSDPTQFARAEGDDGALTSNTSRRRAGARGGGTLPSSPRCSNRRGYRECGSRASTPLSMTPMRTRPRQLDGRD